MNRRYDKDHPYGRPHYSTGGNRTSRDEDYPYTGDSASFGEGAPSYPAIPPSWSSLGNSDSDYYPYEIEGDSGPASPADSYEQEKRAHNPWAAGNYSRWYPSDPDNPTAPQGQPSSPEPLPPARSLPPEPSHPDHSHSTIDERLERGHQGDGRSGPFFPPRYPADHGDSGGNSFRSALGVEPARPPQRDWAPPPPGGGYYPGAVEAPPQYLPAPAASHQARPLYPTQHVLDPKKSIADKVDMIRRGKWYIVVVFVLVMGAVVAYTETATPTYEAYSLLMIDTRQGLDGGGEGGLNLGESGITSRKLPNQALILGQSLLIAERTAARLLELKKVPETGESLSVLGGSAREVAERLQSGYVQIMPASDMEDADGIKVTASGPSAGEVALIANLYAEEYVALAQETSQRDVVNARTYLEQQVALKRDELYTLEAEIEQYTSTEGTVSLENDAGLVTQQIAQLERDLDQARIDESMKEASVTSLERELTQLQPTMVDRVASGADQEIQTAQQEITTLEARLELVYQKNPELREHPEDNASLRKDLDRIEALKARVRDLSQKYVDQMYASGGVDPSTNTQGVSYIAELRQTLARERVALSGAKAKVVALETRLAEYRRKLNTIPVQTSQHDKLKREKETVESQYLDMVGKLQQARIKEESTKSFAQIIRPATLPDSPVKPRKAVNMSLGALLGLLLGFGSAFARHKLDTRIYGPDDIRQGEYPLLGVVPDMTMTIQRELGRGGMIGSNAGIVNAALVSYLSPLSPEAEAYRRLLANMQFKGIRQDVKSILVTSPEMGAGKTVTALNIAVTAAQAGRKTLIVDADMHRPSLHMNLGFSQDPRRTRMLFEGRVPVRLEEFRTGINNLYALSLRDLIAIPGELLASHEMRSLIARLRTVFDLVVFDSPPVLGASDASILGAQADATIIVAAAGQTQVEDLDAAASELRGIGARLFGAVLNRCDPARGGSKYPAYPYRQAKRRLFF